MKFALNHEHGPGLRRELRTWPLLKKSLSFHHPRFFIARIKYPVRFQVKIAGARSGIGADKLAPLFNIEPHRAVIWVEHASIQGEGELAAFVVVLRLVDYEEDTFGGWVGLIRVCGGYLVFRDHGLPL